MGREALLLERKRGQTPFVRSALGAFLQKGFVPSSTMEDPQNVALFLKRSLCLRQLSPSELLGVPVKHFCVRPWNGWKSGSAWRSIR